MPAPKPIIYHVVMPAKVMDGIRDFAKDCALLRQADYNRRNPAPLDKIEKDLIVGKMAEWGVYAYLRSIHPGEDISTPDMALYSAQQRRTLGHGADLTMGDMRIGVKACPCSPKSANASWVFQRNDPLHDAVYYFTEVDQYSDLVRVLWEVEPDTIRDLGAALRNGAPSKVAVYHQDLIQETLS